MMQAVTPQAAPAPTAVIGDMVCLYGLTDRALADLRHRLTWDLGGRRELRAYVTLDGGGIAIPYGSMRLAQVMGCSIDDRTVAPPLAVALLAELRDYQRRALAACAGKRGGVIVAPTAAGKTVMMAGLIAQRQTTALVLVHTRPLLAQTVRELRRLLNIPIGHIGDGACDVRPVTVALVQSMRGKRLIDLAEAFGLLVIDEVHHGAALTWRAVVDGLPARYRFGFTATPDRKDGLRPVVEAYLGPIAVEVPRWAAAAHLAPVTIERIDTGRSYTVEPCSSAIARKLAWGRLMAAVARDGERNAFIAAEVRRRLEARAGDQVLVLTDRVAHAEAIAALLADLDPVLLAGPTGKRARAAAMERVRAGARLTIGTVHLLGEGLDLPGWSVLVLAAPFAGGPRTAQAVGRVARPAPGKARGLVIDLVDDHPALQASWWARRRVYQSCDAQISRAA